MYFAVNVEILESIEAYCTHFVSTSNFQSRSDEAPLGGSLGALPLGAANGIRGRSGAYDAAG